jgi:hypothetical protein
MARIVAIAVVLGCLLAASAGEVPAEAGEGTLLGDADCSGAVNPVDSLVILRQDSGSGAAACPELADVQCDGDVDPIDALQLLRFDAGLTVNQEEGCAGIGEPVGPPPSSEELIAQALADDEITYE